MDKEAYIKDLNNIGDSIINLIDKIKNLNIPDCLINEVDNCYINDIKEYACNSCCGGCCCDVFVFLSELLESIYGDKLRIQNPSKYNKKRWERKEGDIINE